MTEGRYMGVVPKEPHPTKMDEKNIEWGLRAVLYPRIGHIQNGLRLMSSHF